LIHRDLKVQAVAGRVLENRVAELLWIVEIVGARSPDSEQQEFEPGP
jgi:hypothetical protein